MQNIHEIKLKISGTNSNLPINIVQGDTNTRILQVSLINDDGSNYTPGQGVTAEYYSQKPDGTGTSHSATLSGNVVTVTLTEQDTAAAGMVYAAIRLKAGSQLLAAIPFMFKCIKFPMGNNVASTSEYQTMQDATNEANAAAETANEAATTAVQTANNAAQQALSIANAAADNANDAADYATEAADTASNYNIDLLAEGYDATAIYVKGDYAIYQGALYRCITDIVTPEAWTASHWVAVELGADVQDAWRDATEGYSDTLTAGDLTSDEYQTDTEPYLFRRTFGGANNHEMDTLVGGTVAWNQLMQNGDFANGTSNWWGNRATISMESNQLKSVVNNASTNFFGIGKTANLNIANHVFVSIIDAETNNENFQNFRISFSVNSTIVQEVNYKQIGKQHYVLYKATQNIDTIYYRAFFSQTVTSGVDYVLFNSVQFIDLTQMFGSTIADAIYAMEQAEAGSGVAWFRRYFPEDYYAYDSGTLKSVEAVAHRMVGKNKFDKTIISDVISSTKYKPIYVGDGTFTMSTTAPQNNNSSANLFLLSGNVNTGAVTGTNGVWVGRTRTVNSENGYVTVGYRKADGVNPIFYDTQIEYGSTATTFKPFAQHTYKLSPLTLRGIPKLIDGKLQYDGDTYEPSGQVVRKYGVVDLGTLTNWASSTITEGNNRFYAGMSGVIKAPSSTSVMPNILCTAFPSKLPSEYNQATEGITIYTNSSIQIYSSKYATYTVEQFKTAMSGVYLVYELATPTTETASPYEPTQVVYADGTEEYISQNIVPVGHSTKYPVSLKSKLNDLPDAFKLYDMFVHDSVTEPSAVLSVSDGADDVPVKNMTIGIEPVQSGSGDPSPSNVRPISGWTQAKIMRTGKNLLHISDATFESGTVTLQDGIFKINGTFSSKTINLTNYVNLSELNGLIGTEITYSKTNIKGEFPANGIYFSASGSTYYLQMPNATGETTATLNKELTGLRLYINGTYDVEFKLQIELGSTATTYEPFKGNTYTVTLPDTVYGGELTVNRDGTGTLVVDRAYWKCTTANTTMRTGGFRFYSNPTPIGEQPGSHSNNIISDRIPTATDTQLRDTGNIQELFCYIHGTSGGINFNTSSVYASVSDMIAEIGEIEFVYKMKNAITYTLTAPQVRTLLGINNIWADTGDILEAVYPADTKLYIYKKLQG